MDIPYRLHYAKTLPRKLICLLEKWVFFATTVNDIYERPQKRKNTSRERSGEIPLGWPVEVIPYAKNYVLAEIKKLNGAGKIRLVDGKPLVTEQGNLLIDGDFGLIQNPAALAGQLTEIVGVVEHGLFINIATTVIMGVGDSTETFTRA
jgi:ribose 5-phosphate isomerase